MSYHIGLEMIVMTVDITDRELHDLTVACTRFIRDRKRGFGLTIHGFNDDQREVWDIPEIQKLCKRLVDIGFISVLDPGVGKHRVGGALSAILVYKIAGGGFDGTCSLTRRDIEQFFELLGRCNEKCDAMEAACNYEPTMHAIVF